MHSGLEIDREAIQNDLERSADFGMVDTDDGVGRTVLTGTPANFAARNYFVDRMITAGLNVSVDAVGNITGRWSPPECDDSANAVAAGSHLDSVPEGGIFDGPLGVYAALEAVRTIKRSDWNIDRPIEVVCFTGEEGTRFSDGVLGSSVAAGKQSVEQALSLSDGETTLEEALEDIGFQGDGRVDASKWDSWIELHIEQAKLLERAEEPVGVVSRITGTTRCHVRIEGEANHAGTTTMRDRDDALAAASELILTIESEAQDVANQESSTAVATVGSLNVEPGATNVIPGIVTLDIDIRDVERSSINRILQTIKDACESIRRNRGLTVSIETPYDIPPQPMTGRVRDALQDGAKRLDMDPPTLSSGAGHDTMQVATVTDAGMLFARSRGGHSHSPLEHTDWLDCAFATQVLTDALAELAGANPAPTDKTAINQS
ncbi:Zn-dependent hydrolase [Haloquadratum walsbyi]|jgi:amidase, hydantoinase/carbamoylase family|uniref:Amidase, hydantoinase/carbamoylase family n=1 Tax=Haloquadratum walsbyi J07HQW2 TaxID=1238425 RepID=U1PTM6_9EURY|nr:Zn-dependent hydrolase [Haloquadratum walsbyi]ERG97157.1 MAG: amidase, hydantoinase/carbamoylase family [Haloquadratum walsbyi J07HQW2]